MIRGKILKDLTPAESLKDFNSAVMISQVMPSYVCHGWKVKKPFSELLPEVDPQGKQAVWMDGLKVEYKCSTNHLAKE